LGEIDRAIKASLKMH